MAGPRRGSGQDPWLKWAPAFAGVARWCWEFPKSPAVALLLGIVVLPLPVLADEEPKRSGSLNYMIPADAPPSFDGHRETTYATIHTAAPFYSVLIRVNPENP